jgi:hypothetical protein
MVAEWLLDAALEIMTIGEHTLFAQRAHCFVCRVCLCRAIYLIELVSRAISIQAAPL